MAHGVYGNGQGFGWGPASAQSGANCCRFNSGATFPGNHGEGFATVTDEVVVPLITSLFQPGSPAAIAGFIVAFIVGVSVDAMRRAWARPHVGKEVGEPVLSLPAFANRDPATAIVFVIAVFLPEASVPELAPTSPSPCSGLSVDKVSSAGSLTLKTPAGLGMSAAKVATSDNALCPASATTKPFSPARFCTSQDGKPAKSHAREIDESRHRNDLSDNGHAVSPVIRTGRTTWPKVPVL